MSDSRTSEPFGLVIGTAGHIDHGKTALVYALTGMDTDRLEEEKRRGISIDLGFAHLTLPGGRRVGVVDVPGHQRFIRNMLAGVGGIEAVVLVVAADESVMPQTREHFDICRLLHVRTGVVAISKCDLADVGRMEQVRADVRALCAGSFLQDADIIPVSARTNYGIEELRRAITLLMEKKAAREEWQVARLTVDRCFAVPGFGTVVTGTLRGGPLRVGDAVALHPSGLTARIRGLEVHGEAMQQVLPGNRAGVNLSGVEHSQVQRGSTLTAVADIEGSDQVDVSLEWLNAADAGRQRQQIVLHAGTAEISGSLKVLTEPGAAIPLGRLLLSEPVLVFPGDRFVLRRPSPAQTIAGGVVIDAFPPPRMSKIQTTNRLKHLLTADAVERIRYLVAEGTQGRRLQELVKLTGFTKERVTDLVESDASLKLVVPAARVVSHKWIAEKRSVILASLLEFHRQFPGLEGAPLARLKTGLDTSLAATVFHDFADIRIQGDVIALAGHQSKTNDADTHKMAQMETAFRSAGFQPPSQDEVLRLSGSDAKSARLFLETLIRGKRLVRVSADLVFHADAIQQLRMTLSVQKGRKFSVSDFKDWTKISRKYAIPLLEYLDRERVTRRDGEARIVLQ